MRSTLNWIRRVALGVALVPLAAVAATVFAGQANAQASPSAYTTGYRWDAVRHLVGEISAPANPAVPSTGPYRATRYTYDADGQVRKIEKGALSIWQSEAVLPKDWGTAFTVELQTELTYDAVGNKVLELVRAMPSGAIRSQVQTKFDALNRPDCSLVKMNDPGGLDGALVVDACLPGSGIGWTDRVTKTMYDSAGQVLQVRKAVGTPREQAYVTYTYTSNGKQQSVIDANGNRARFKYDGFDRLSEWLFPPAQGPVAFDPSTPATAVATATAANVNDYERYTYDAGGNRTSLRKRDGQVLTYAYDALSRMIQKKAPGGEVTTACNGLAADLNDTCYAYDLRGLMQQARFGGSGGADGLFNEFDKAGRLVGSTLAMDGTSRTIRSCYDANGSRTRASYPDSATSSGNCAAAWTNYVSYEYDGLNRPAHVRENGSAPLRSYTYNPKGQLETELSVGGAAGSTSFQYDPVGRLKSMFRNLAGTFQDNTAGFEYNNASQIVQEERSNDAYAYTARQNGSLSYTPNGLNQYAAVGSTGYCHDANGNLTADGYFVYLYDVENRLVEKREQVQVNPACTALAYTGLLKQRLRYDPMGRLYETWGPVLGTTRFLIDGDALVAEYDGLGALLRRYVHGANGKADDPIAWYEGAAMWSANLRLLYANHQGSLVATVLPDGTTQKINRYDEYGVPYCPFVGGIPNCSDPTSNAGRFQYTGQAWLPELGMYYYKARIYAPRLGRFMQTDPIGYEDQVNLYAYVGNDPLNKTDLDGKTLRNLIRGVVEFISGVISPLVDEANSKPDIEPAPTEQRSEPSSGKPQSGSGPPTKPKGNSPPSGKPGGVGSGNPVSPSPGTQGSGTGKPPAPYPTSPRAPGGVKPTIVPLPPPPPPPPLPGPKPPIPTPWWLRIPMPIIIFPDQMLNPQWMPPDGDHRWTA